MYGERLRPSYGQGRYNVVPPRAPEIVDIYIYVCVLQIRLTHHVIGKHHPRKFSPNTASVEEQGDDLCRNEPSRGVPTWQRTFRSAHRGETYAPLSAARFGWEESDRNGG